MSKEQKIAIRSMLSKGPQGFTPLPVEQMRENFAQMMAQFPVPTDVTQTERELAGRPAVLVEPQEITQEGTILYFHGGSFALGSPQTAMAVTAHLVRLTGMRAISFDYRLAPEHPFPAGIEDCLSAYRALLNEGVPAQQIVFAGDSAGGGLSITATLAARDEGLELPAGIVTFSAGLDSTRTGKSMETKNGIDPFFKPEGLAHTGNSYRGEADPHQPLLSPAIYDDFTDFPPVLIQVGTDELLMDDSTRLAERIREFEGDVILDVVGSVPHVFQAFAGMLDEADEALERAALFIKQKTRN